MIDKFVRAIEEDNLDLARVVFYEYAKEAPKVFKSFDQPWEHKQDEAAINSTFLVPLAMAFCGVDDVEEMKQGEKTVASLIKLNEQAGTTPGRGRTGQMCGYVFKEGEPTFSCRECALDPTCVLCQECFSQSAHKDHKYRMYTSNGSGYCDCGDPDAWSAHFACTTHSPNNDDVNVPTTLPDHLLPRLRMITTVVIEYAVRMLSWPKEESFLLQLPGLKQITEPKRTFQTILYNDETHTYDSVIRALELSIHCSKEQAMMLATFVDKEGCTSVATGDKDQCVRVLTDIKRRTQRDHSRRTERQGPLEVHVVESELVSHQHLAIALLQWLSDQLAVFPLLSDVVGAVLLDERPQPVEGMETDESSPGSAMVEGSPADGSVMDTTGVNDFKWTGKAKTLVDVVMLSDRAMWKHARSSWHQMLMKTVLMNMDQKLAFTRRFLQLYKELQYAFIEDDQEHDVSVVALSVQMLTVPPIARKVVLEERALFIIMDAFNNHLEKWVEEIETPSGVPRRKLDFSKHSYPVALKRSMHMIRDLVYLLTQTPSKAEWDCNLRGMFAEGFLALLKLLDVIQGMDEVKRQEGEHTQYEMEWETAFNMQLRLQEMITLFVSWANSDLLMHQDCVDRVLQFMEDHIRDLTPPIEPGVTHDDVTVGHSRQVVPKYDILKNPVSIHIPIWRIFAGLVATPLPEARRYLDPSCQPRSQLEARVRDVLKNIGTNLYDLQIRILVLCAQISCGVWRRNGFSLVNQVHNYYSPLCRSEMYDQDIVALQYAAATVKDANKFLIMAMQRFRIAEWANSLDYELSTVSDDQKTELTRHTVLLAEEFLTTIINIFSERYRPGVGACTRQEALEREIIHVLAAGPQTFSYIQQRLNTDPLLYKLSMSETVANVADFKRVTVNAPGKFQLKDQYLDRFDTYFFHYNRSASSAAEQYQKKYRAGKDRSLRACPPPLAIPFSPLFHPATRLLLAPALVCTLSHSLQRVAKKSRFGSEALLQRALYLIGLGLHEQSRNLTGFDFVNVAMWDDHDLLVVMERLAGKPESEPHGDLLWWTIQKFKEVRSARNIAIEEKEGTTSPTKAEDKETDEKMKKAEDEAEEAEKKKKAKAALAAKMRANAMIQMQKMQKKFTAQVEEVEKTGKEENADQSEAKDPAEQIVVEEDYDEDNDCPVQIDKPSSFPVCIGPAKHTVEKVRPRLITCVLCQEKEPLDAAHANFVCAAYVQRSQLFSQHVPSADLRLESFLVNSALIDEMDTSTCSHTMHYECYGAMIQSVATTRRGRQLLTSNVLDPDSGEYQCPMCKRLCNTALPLLPAVQTIEMMGFSSNHIAGEDETFDNWVTEMRRFVALTKPKHSRKRSHSERSLLDLGREVTRANAQRDPIAQGALESAMSNSVPSASQMNLWDGPPTAAAAAAQRAADEEFARILMDPNLPATPPHRRAANGREPELNADDLRRLLGGERLDDEMDMEELIAIAAGELRDDMEPDEELMMLLRGAADAVVADARNAARGRPPNDPNPGAPMFDINIGFPGQAGAVVPDIDFNLMLGRQPEAAEVADGDGAAAGEVAMMIDDNEDEDAEPDPAAAARARAVARRELAAGRQIELAAEAVQRRVQAIPSVLTSIIRNLPATIRAKLSKRVLPLAVTEAEKSVRHFTEFLMKTHELSEETRSFSSTITVWRTTTHVLRCVSAILAIEGKPLFGALNTRQRECITSLARLSAYLSCNIAPFGELIKVMLRMLLHPEVANPYSLSRPTFRSTLASTSNSSIGPSTSASGEAGSSSAPLSPPPVYNCRPPLKEEKDTKKKRGPAAAAAFAMFFSSDKKEQTFNILNIDILALTMELMMCIGWTWHDGVRTAKNVSPQSKEMVADGSSDELHVMRLGLTAFLFQVIATHTDSTDESMESGEEGGEEEELERRVEELWREIKGTELRDAKQLAKSLRSSTIIFLRPLALLYHSLRLLPPPEALRDPSVDEFDPLCRYMGLPPSMLDLLSSPVLDDLFTMWSPCVPADVKEVPKQPAVARQLIDLPKDFSELITLAAKFRCPSIPLDEKSTMPTMCLLCGQMLCSQSYCCQKFINKDNVGACMQHLPTCTGGTGVFLRIRDCYMVFLTNRLRGCIRAAPYVDEFGEVDQGFRRGNPMHLNEEMYSRMRHIWLHQNISEEVVNRYELDTRNMAYEWNHF